GPVDTRRLPPDDGLSDNRPDGGRGDAMDSIEQSAGAAELGPDGPAPEPPRARLSALLVAAFSRTLAGPYASMLLADLGAEVVKVESPSGDDTRTWMPPVRDGVSSYYLGINRNKRSIALALTDDRDAALARELAGRADILLENFRTGGLIRF